MRRNKEGNAERLTLCRADEGRLVPHNSKGHTIFPVMPKAFHNKESRIKSRTRERMTQMPLAPTHMI